MTICLQPLQGGSEFVVTPLITTVYYLQTLTSSSANTVRFCINIRDVTEPAKTASVGCGFHVQNPSDADADLLREQN